jgi:D-proline reductase (dithiol) PrdB
MVRLTDLHPDEAAHMEKRASELPEIEPGQWITPKPLSESRVAIISTAGMHRRTDAPFTPGAVDYRIVPGDASFDEMVLSHISTNFDRSAFQQDPNIAFPLDRLREMAEAGEIGSVASWHYSFMGAMPVPTMFEETGTDVGRLLAADDVDVALLIPV